MRYFDEMRTKYGFEDGEAIPPDAVPCREVYIRAINTLAAMMGSGVRAYAYDRPGVHNYCLILFVPLEVALRAGLDPQRLHDAAYVQDSACQDETNRLAVADWSTNCSVEPDAGMRQAIQAAHELELDRFVSTRVRVDLKGLARELKKLPAPGRGVM